MNPNFGYMRMVEKEPKRIWEVRDKDGRLIDRGRFMDCAVTAANYDMKLSSIH